MDIKSWLIYRLKTVVNKKNEVDGDHVPAKHFGVILPWDKWDQLVKILKDKDVSG